MCVDGSASLHTSHRRLKQWAREIIAAEPSFDAQRPLKWSSTPIIFDTEDHPDRTTVVRCLPLLVSPTILSRPVFQRLNPRKWPSSSSAPGLLLADEAPT